MRASARRSFFAICRAPGLECTGKFSIIGRGVSAPPGEERSPTDRTESKRGRVGEAVSPEYSVSFPP